MKRTIYFLLAACFALGISEMGAAENSAPAEREKLLLDFNWRFQLGDAPDAGGKFDYPEVSNLAKTRLDEIGKEAMAATPADLGHNVSFVQPNFNDSRWRKLDLPHDWAVELPFDEKSDVKHGFKPVGPGFETNSIGWYRREFELPAADQGKTLWLEFDGVFRNSIVWLNGHCLGRHVSGYSSFRYDISQLANFGGKNMLVVRVDASRFEGWFYEGAGIYRHVWLEKAAPLAIAPDGIFVWSKFENNDLNGICEVHIQTQLQNSQTNAVVKCEIITSDGKSLGQTHHVVNANGRIESRFDLCPPNEPLGRIEMVGDVTPFHSPALWSPENPKLYKLITTVESDGKIVDRKETEFGIRTIAFDTDKGFLLNGKPYVLKGTCNHQDHAGVGAAMPDALQYFRVQKLKEMGCNAIRTSHNAPTPELLDACDRLGLLVMDENRRMDTNDYALNELRGLILRDRNHPSVFIWSLGNEENFLQGTNGHEAAIAVVTAMQNLAHQLDPTRLCTVAMNGGWGEGISKAIDVQGFNYHTTNIDKFRATHPAKLSIGTETASTRVTRGIYEDDKPRGYVAAYGANGIAPPWGWWPYFATHAFTSGGFVWTGFDYRGEPTPYKWPCINSHFGVMDMCGFPKDIYFYYKAWWTNEPMVHIMPHWNWPDKIGQEIPVRVFSNCHEVELFLNGKSLGRQKMEPNQFLDWKVKYEPGELSAKGYNGGKVAYVADMPTTGAAAKIELWPDRKVIRADGEDLSLVAVKVVDDKGRVVPVAGQNIHFEIQGPGKIIGVGNGDPSSHEPDKANERKAFCGYAQVIVQAAKTAGKIQLTATAPGLKTAALEIGSEPAALRPAVP